MPGEDAGDRPHARVEDAEQEIDVVHPMAVATLDGVQATAFEGRTGRGAPAGKLARRACLEPRVVDPGDSGRGKRGVSFFEQRSAPPGGREPGIAERPGPGQ